MSISSSHADGHLHQQHQAQQSAAQNPELARQFASLMKKNKELEIEDAIEESSESEEADSLDRRKDSQDKLNTPSTKEPSLPQTIHRIQKQLTRLSKSSMSKDRLQDLKNHAQSKINTLKKDGYKLKDLELPNNSDL